MTLGTLLPLSGCGTSTPSAVGSYEATFTIPKGTDTHVTLTLDGDGHFVVRAASVPILTGTWSQMGSKVRLRQTDNAITTVLVATLVGTDLRHGYEIVYPPSKGPLAHLAPIIHKQSWYATRR